MDKKGNRRTSVYKNLTDLKKLKQCGASVVDLIDVAWLSKVKVIAKDKIQLRGWKSHLLLGICKDCVLAYKLLVTYRGYTL